MQQLIETILVALILIIEVADVARHWRLHETTHITIDCTHCLESAARSLRQHIGTISNSNPTSRYAYSLSTPTNPDTSTGEDGDSATPADPEANAHTARAFLCDQHRHVRQPVQYSGKRVWYLLDGHVYSNLPCTSE